MTYVAQKLKTRTERTAISILDSDILALQILADSEWYQIQAGELKEYIGQSSSIAPTILITTNLLIYRDPTDTTDNDGITMIVKNAEYDNISWRSNGTYHSISSPASVILEAPDDTYSRIDLIYLSSTGTLERKTGTPSVNPTRPTIPYFAVSVSFVLVNTDGSLSLITSDYDVLQAPPHTYYVKATDINQDTIDIALFYSIREGYNVYVNVNSKPLTYGNGYTFEAGTNIVTINLKDTLDFTYKLQAGWPIQIFYTKKDAVTTTLTGIRLTDITVDITPESDDLTFELFLSNDESYPVDVLLNLQFTNDDDVLLKENGTIFRLQPGSNVFVLPVYQNLVPDIYTLTVTGATAELSGQISEEIINETPEYTNTCDSYRATETSAIGLTSVTNTNNVGGNVVRIFKLDGAATYPVNRYIAPGATEIFQANYTIDSSEHTIDIYDINLNLICSQTIPALAGTTTIQEITSDNSYLARLSFCFNTQGARDLPLTAPLNPLLQNYNSFNNINWITDNYSIENTYQNDSDFLRMAVPTGLSGVSSAILKMPVSNYAALSLLGIRSCNIDISQATQDDFEAEYLSYFSRDNLVDSISYNAGIITFTFNSNMYTLLNGNSDGYIDLQLSYELLTNIYYYQTISYNGGNLTLEIVHT